MSKRYLQWGYESFKDNKTGEIHDNYIELLNQQDQRIAELEEQLKGCIRPKFRIGQEVFVIIENTIGQTRIDSITIFENNELSYYCKYVDNIRMYLELDESDVFATKEEALAKLQELKG